MQGFNFSQRLRAVLDGARAEAQRLHHEYIGTEHLLLALLHAEPNLATETIESFGVRIDPLVAKAEEIIRAGTDIDAERLDLPYTPRATKVLELSMAEARDLNHSYLGVEHLLLGLLREKKGVAGQVLVSEGITLDAARARLLQILDERWPDAPTRHRQQRGGAWRQ